VKGYYVRPPVSEPSGPHWHLDEILDTAKCSLEHLSSSRDHVLCLALGRATLTTEAHACAQTAVEAEKSAFLLINSKSRYLRAVARGRGGNERIAQ
jgi:hypothetical protein